MAHKKPKKMKWWKNSSLLFTGAVLIIPLVIFSVTLSMVIKNSSVAKPSASPNQSFTSYDDAEFSQDAFAYLQQGERIAVYGLRHTNNVALNSAAGRLQKNLAAPKKALKAWLKRNQLDGYAITQGKLALPEGMVADLNAASDRNMAAVMTDFANAINRTVKYHLGSTEIVLVKQQLETAANMLAHDVHAVLVGN